MAVDTAHARLKIGMRHDFHLLDRNNRIDGMACLLKLYFRINDIVPLIFLPRLPIVIKQSLSQGFRRETGTFHDTWKAVYAGTWKTGMMAHRKDSRRRKMCKSNRPDRRGFTLLELVMAMVIFSIVAAISVPTFRDFLAQRRLNGAARELHGNLMSMRMQAVSENRWIALNVDNTHQYTIFRDLNQNGTVDSGEILVVKNLHPTYYDVVFDTGASASGVTFRPNGTGSTATLRLTGATGVKTLTVTNNGRVKTS
jgi:type IV fimbrial biogenesis protein FimT